MSNSLGYADIMGPLLKAEVERQLTEDLAAYGVQASYLTFDYSETCPEGHMTSYLDGALENWSNIGVTDANGKDLAAGWLEFIHGGDDNPLFVFWDYLYIFEGRSWKEVKSKPGIPEHVWSQLPESSKELCATEGKYDAMWCKDPIVVKWKQSKQ